MAKEMKLTEKTELALNGLKALGGSATLEDLKSADYAVGSANLGSLVKNGLAVAEDVEVEYVAVKVVKKYTLVETEVASE